MDTASSSSETIPASVRDWDAKFREKPEEWFFGREPSELARLTYNYWGITHGDARCRVLDLGAGEGRDSVFFTTKGFEVAAVDGSEVALDKTRALAADRGVEVSEIVQADAADYPLPSDFQILYSHNCLQFLGDKCVPRLRELQEATPPGGLNAISVFTNEATEERPGRGPIYRFDRNELKGYYDGWRLLFYGEEVLWREPSQCYLSFARIIAQKTASPS